MAASGMRASEQAGEGAQRKVQGTPSRTYAHQEYSCARLGPFLVKAARAIAGSIVFLLFRSDAAMSESRQTVGDFQPRQLFTAMHVELWREFLRSVERSDGNVNFVRPAGRFV